MEYEGEEGIEFGQLQFDKLTEEERLQTEEERLFEAVDFVDSMKDLGTINYSSTRIDVDEIRCLIEKSKMYLSSKGENTSFNNNSETKIIKDEKVLGSRRFEELTDIEKVQLMELKLQNLIKFLDEMQGSGRTYFSSLDIETNELRWFVENAKICVNRS